MAKVTKELLKEIVKECLVEILAEGINGGDSNQLRESISTKKENRMPNSIRKMMPPKKTKNESFEKNISNVIASATSDPILSSILEDTAKTTLQEQNSADGSNKFVARHNDEASKIVSESDPAELFGGSANNWAKLAFSDS
jgi:hypothetical protein